MSELWFKNENIKRWCITNIRKASSNVLSEAPLSERNVSLTKSIFDLYFNTACAVHSVYCITSIISCHSSETVLIERAYLTEMLLFRSRIIFNLICSTRRWGCVIKVSLGRGPDKPYLRGIHNLDQCLASTLPCIRMWLVDSYESNTYTLTIEE